MCPEICPWGVGGGSLKTSLENMVIISKSPYERPGVMEYFKTFTFYSFANYLLFRDLGTIISWESVTTLTWDMS